MSHNFDTISVDIKLDELSEIFARTRHHGVPVLDPQGKLWGVVTVYDLDQAFDRGLSKETRVADIGTRRPNLLVAYPDEGMGAALGRMGTRGIGRLPVVSREDPEHLIGLIRRGDIIRAYNLALSRRGEIRQKMGQAKLSEQENLEFVEIRLEDKYGAVGKSLESIALNLPTECLLVSVRRDGRVVIPRGDTVFQVGDHITAFVRSQDTEALFASLRENHKSV